MYSNIQTTFLDYPNPTDIAVIYYTFGCIHNCINCQNPNLQEYKSSTIPINKLIEILIDYCKRNKTNKIVLSGGDPLYNKNIYNTNILINELNKNYDICIYTGYEIDYVKQNLAKGFKFIKCGKYNEALKIKSEKTDNYIQLASTNQSFYNSNYKLLSNKGRYYFNEQGE